MIRVRFVKARGRRVSGDVVAYDENSAAAIVAEGAAEYVDEPDSAVVSTVTAELAVAEERAAKAREKAARANRAAQDKAAEGTPDTSGD